MSSIPPDPTPLALSPPPSQKRRRGIAFEGPNSPLGKKAKVRRLLDKAIATSTTTEVSVDAKAAFNRMLEKRLQHSERTSKDSIVKGMLLYYHHNHPLCAFEQHACLLSLRAEQIREELQELAFEHTQASINEIASGQTFRLLSSFCSLMIDAKTGEFNPGGTEAVQAFLADPKYRLSHYLHPEHREQVLRIVQCCLESNEIQKLLVCPFTPHPEMNRLIALSLKIPEERLGGETFRVSHALLMTLFAHLKQGDVGNCYAIAPLIFELHAAPHHLLKELIQLLQLGHFTLHNETGDDAMAPILPLVQNRLNDEKPLEVEKRSDRVLSLSAITHSASILGMDTSSGSPYKKRPIRASLQSIAAKSECEAHYPDLVRCLAAYDKSPLQIILLLNRELNDINTLKSKASIISYFKKCIQMIYEESADSKEMPSQLERAISERLNRELWFENVLITTIDEDSFGPTFDRHPLPKAVATDPTFRRLIEKGRFLFTIDENHTYTRIATIPQFEQLIRDVCASIIPEGKTRENLLEILTQPVLKKPITFVIREMAKMFNYELSSETIQTANLMIFPQTGGHVTSALSHKEHSFLASTPEGCLKQLLGVLNLLPDQWIDHPLPLMVANRTHIFTLTPYHFPRCYSSVSIQQMISDTVNERFRALLDEPVLSAAQDYLKEKICELMITDEEAEVLTYRTLSSKLNTMTPENYQSFYEATIHAFSLIECSPALISSLLSSLYLNPELADAIYEQLPAIYLTTQHFAEHLSQQLGQMGVANTHPIELEQIICAQTGRPATFVLGSLNWTAEGRESNTCFWEIAFEPITKQFFYVAREKGKSKRPLAWQPFTKIDIYLPNTELAI